MIAQLSEQQRIVITGIGLPAPNGNNLAEYRESLLEGRSGVVSYTIRYFGDTVAGVCHFDAFRHQTRKEVRRGTRAGSVAVYCANEAVIDSGIDATHPAPAVAVWHQHAGQWHLGKTEPAGLAGNPMHHTGVALAREGYVAFALDMYGKGIRPKTNQEAGKQAVALG